MSDRRLIEEWLPIAALSEESRRERRSMTALPPTYYLHVWWARRPLIASRAAILASLLPADVDRDMFTRTIGILGDPVEARRSIDAANRKGIRLNDNPYGYRRAFEHQPSAKQREWVNAELRRSGMADAVVLDPTAGGGSIPFESARLGFRTLANDLNPVASVLLKATVEWPVGLGARILPEYDRLAARFLKLAEERLEGIYPLEIDETCQVLGYIWARTIECPYCEGTIPLSPNWRIGPGGIGIRLGPSVSADGVRACDIEVVDELRHHSAPTVKGAAATCPFDDCKRVVDSPSIKTIALQGALGETLVAVAFKSRCVTTTASGRTRERWVRGYRGPRPEDDVAGVVAARLAERLPEWEAMDFVPSESFPTDGNDKRPIAYGMPRWIDQFNPRQLLVHGTSVEVYRQLVAEEEAAGLTPETTAALVYLALPFDKLRDYSSRMTRWHSGRGVIVNTFDRHDFAFKWSYAELPVTQVGLGYEWVIGQVRKALGELIQLGTGVRGGHSAAQPQLFGGQTDSSRVSVSCEPAQDLRSVESSSVDCIVMDPPYFQNVMYAELSDFFYVWLRRTAGQLLPEFFSLLETDKENEAVANPARFTGERGAGARAGRDYQEKMAAVFGECRRTLSKDGVLVLMFTHKATDAWDALTTGLIDAGFMITASWPINTESESSLHIKDKSAANSTMLLVCRPRPQRDAAEVGWWEEVEPRVRQAVRSRIDSFQEAGIRGVDLYLSAFGPALEEFSRHWPLRRGQPRAEPAARERKQAELFGEEWDPYAVTPEDALDAARREVKRWRIEQIIGIQRKADLDPVLEFFVLAWDAFEAPRFPYDEALRLARVVGVDLETEIVGRICEKKQSDLVMLDAEQRAALGGLGPADGSRTMLDALHHAAWIGRSRTLTAAKELLERANLMDSPALHHALAAVLEVLPPFKLVPDFELDDAVSGAANDFATLEHLRRLCLTGQVKEPKQLAMWIS